MAKVTDKAEGESQAKLTPKQEAFVNYYLEHGNASDAYRRAYQTGNMSPVTVNREAHSLLENHKIATRLLLSREKAAQEAVLSRAWVLRELMDNVTKAKATADYTASNKALELLGKTDELAMFTERKHIESDNRHHHAGDVSPYHEFIAGIAGASSEEPSKEPLPN